MSSLSSRDPEAPAHGSLVGPWRILVRYDSGSYGEVYRVARAGHPEAGAFALKLAVHPEDPRFQREAELLQRVVHPSVPRFEDRGWWTGPNGRIFPYVVMEWVKGMTLYEWAREQKPTSRQVLQVLAQLASALAATHGMGGVHRDVKGDNVLVTATGRAVLLDFGCGSFEGAKALTDTALPPGTSSYRTPEAIRWGWFHRGAGTPYQAGPADDVYALGVAAYRLCTGKYPPAPTESSGPRRRLLRPSELATVSKGLDQLLLTALNEDRLARPLAASWAASLEDAAKEKDAEAPIVPTPSAARTDVTSSPGPRRRREVPTWMVMAGAAVLGGLVVMAAVKLRDIGRNSSEPAPETLFVTERWRTPPAQAPDAGVGEEALLSVTQTPQPGASSSGLGLAMPKNPLPGQKKPPCEPEYELVALGACWAIFEKKPPCGEGGYEYAGKCVRASFNAPRQPASEQP
ncbi:serine/threonine protein kinase [Hyalangium gracile]|uniref:serine/threonine protein kinase n=1 Tax=Hyalangium gracile TaxID=394092 RepID=UPI001CCFEE59|nr:serine/threonine-protein kinase [Hyalangium gracile]